MPAVLFASTEPPAGPFTQAQVDAGRKAYEAHCAACHKADLAGLGDSLPLTGKPFLTAWAPRSMAQLHDYMKATMPLGSGGSLPADTYLEITAYILSVSGARAGPTKLTAAMDVKIGAIVSETGTQRSAPPIPAVPAAAAVAPVALESPAKPHDPTAFAMPQGPVAGTGLTVHGTVPAYRDVTDADLRNPAPSDWLMYRRNYQGWSYSPLSQVNRKNVGGLQLIWSWALNDGGTQQGTPLVRDGVMFLHSPGNVVQALNAATGELIWENRIGPAPARAFGSGADGTRSLGLFEDKLYLATHDAKLIALDARTGAITWQTEIGDPGTSFEETGGLIIVNGKILVGLTGCFARPVKDQCYISAFDARSGKRAWRFYTVAKAGEPGGDSWGGLPDNQRAGGDTWIAGTYDPDTNLTFWGTAQAKPWRRDMRGSGDGATLYTNSTLALDPDTGKLKWYYNHAPGETLDLDEVFERVVVDDKGRKVVMTIGKPGILWKLDRMTGQYIAARKTVLNNVVNLDTATGETRLRPDIEKQTVDQWLSSCPGPQGARNWPATSFHQPSGTLVVPHGQSCAMMYSNGMQEHFFMPGTERNLGRLSAYDVHSLKTVWTFQQRSPFLTAALTTGGDVLFIGDYDRRFKAVDVRTGKILWQTRLGTTVQGHPVTFSVDGRQYVAVTTGLGGGSPQQKPMVMLDEVHRPLSGNQVYVFALPGTEK